jgi:protein TonB
MNELSQSAAVIKDAASLEPLQRYTLRSDLAQYCLPAASRDVNRKFAWANSICFLFVLVGILGVRMPPIILRPRADAPDIVPVVFTPPEEQPKVEPAPQPDEPEPSPDTVVETPQVLTVVSPSPSVAFPVPVEGPVIVAPSARYASAPPPTPPKPAVPPKPTAFSGNPEDGGFYPLPTPPRWVLEKPNFESVTLLYFYVNPSGSITAVEIKESSGYEALDRLLADWIKKKWVFPPGQTRYFSKEFRIKITPPAK